MEPVEGQFDFSPVDDLIMRARAEGIRLVLLWFGTWKNGDMDYVPAWVKTDPARFRRVTSSTGKMVWVLSSHCPANFEADRAAFVALCRHLAEFDAVERTVIALQVENEPGILASDRDYHPDAQAVFDAPVPPELMAALQGAGHGHVYDLWQRAGGRVGSWPETLGPAAGELMTAWSIATYIDGIAAAARRSTTSRCTPTSGWASTAGRCPARPIRRAARSSRPWTSGSGVRRTWTWSHRTSM